MDATGGDLVIHLADETPSFGSRVAGEPLRVKIANLIHMNPTHRITVDLSEVPIVSSSFADAVFGKLFASLGPLKFGQALELRGVSPTVRALIDKAILQRELVRYGALAMNHPASCAFINWRYDEATWEQPDVRQAWEELMELARKRPAEDCRREGQVSQTGWVSAGALWSNDLCGGGQVARS